MYYELCYLTLHVISRTWRAINDYDLEKWAFAVALFCGATSNDPEAGPRHFATFWVHSTTMSFHHLSTYNNFSQPTSSLRMSYLIHGSTSHTGMGWVDQVPRSGKLFIGGLYALYQTDLIRAAGITHVLSVIDYDPALKERFPDLQLEHLHIRADDHPNENLLQHFEESVKYVDGALKEVDQERWNGEGQEKESGGGGGGVFVHCAMGKSRSATLVVAYLMWKYKLDAPTALAQLVEGRPVCCPNPGFQEQLKVWEKMCQSETEDEKKKIYEEWERTRFTGEYWEWDQRSLKANL